MADKLIDARAGDESCVGVAANTLINSEGIFFIPIQSGEMPAGAAAGVLVKAAFGDKRHTIGAGSNFFKAP
ncbi:hypothetical protein ASZ97_00010 [Brucella melitensis]|nr:Hypothetical protein BMNI_I1056 [Brucella melitensis NI]AHZ81336.1 hypothetical protein DA85_05185 [Brucella canis]AIN90532.1 hypothetical protein DM30_05370 [Brucella abortus]ALF29609.1 hypothetical protein NL70_05280 [Brucella abortus 104M]AOG43753.1 hypothetical protein BFS01_05265 [Brucella sp. 2002734562]AOG49806.1 hypothetical protein BFL33_05180 [Brucella melitensis]EEP63014.1 Hypothetical protein BAAA_2000003 [Brucella abortus str. 2308 A]ERM04623.1 hypothetical protein P408_12100